MATGSSSEDQPRRASHEEAAGQPRSDGTTDAAQPDWADGLRQLYDSVVDEPLPDAFTDLLNRLDEGGSNDNASDAHGPDGGAN
ncbi:MAG: NepR family anti-sigma factor [Erythrobacter sp.]